MWVRALVLAAVPALAWCGSADAGTAAVVEQCEDRFGCASSTIYVAAPGERNDVTVAQGTDGWATVTDRGAPVQAGELCTRVDEHTVRCPAFLARAVLGDGDDRISGEGGLADLGPGDDRAEDVGAATGGEGDDVIVGNSRGGLFEGGPGADSVAGGEGDDFLQGDAGPDRLDGGPGEDQLDAGDVTVHSVGEPGRDVVIGGPGIDLVSYGYRRSPVRVDLADPGLDGAPGGEDLITEVESVAGGHGDDRIVGDGGPNELRAGFSGADVVIGGGGDDHISSSGGPGAGSTDRLDAGDGDDFVFAERGDRVEAGAGDDFVRHSGDPGPPAARVTCGDGEDVVHDPSPATVSASDCEQLRFSPTSVGSTGVTLPQPRRARGRLDVRVPCRYRAGCRTAITVRSLSGRLLESSTTRRLRLRTAAAVRVHVVIRSRRRQRTPDRTVLRFRVARG